MRVPVGELAVQRGAAHAGLGHHQLQRRMHAVDAEHGVGRVQQLRAAGGGVWALGGHGVNFRTKLSVFSAPPK
jgi:hypothetical protein